MSAPRLLDISRPLCPTTAVWPGDLLTQLQRVATLEGSCLVNCHNLHLSLHAGTHLDAPFHYDNAGQTVDRLDLEILVGPCTVLALPQPCPDPITAGHLEQARGRLPWHPRLLLNTNGWPNSRTFPMAFPVLSLEAVELLAARGIQLLGLDLPSVDKFPAETIPVHLALHRCGILILESLDLSPAPAGEYELMALPLKLPGAEASPVRAVLRPITLQR